MVGEFVDSICGHCGLARGDCVTKHRQLDDCGIVDNVRLVTIISFIVLDMITWTFLSAQIRCKQI